MLEAEEIKSLSNLKSGAVKKSVVVIDDSPEMLYLVKIILEMDDYDIFTAQSGKEAFKILSEINAPDLILLDMQMDEMSGPEFLLMLEEKLPALVRSVPVVFLTGMDMTPTSKAAGFIRKPIQDIPQFLKTTQRFIESGVNSTYAQ